MSALRLLTIAAVLLLASVAHAELVVEAPASAVPGETFSVVDTDGASTELTVTYYPGSRIEEAGDPLPAAEQSDGQGVRYAFVPHRSGLVRLTAGDASTTIMVGYPRAPLMGIVMLVVALLSLGGLSAIGLKNA